jgi:tetratricopeptide (TPR) repeat protein
LLSAPDRAHAGRNDTIEIGEAVERLRDVDKMIREAEKAAAADKKKTDEELAKRLVEGQLMLAERDVERSAIVFLDLLENNPKSNAASQAMYFLGESLVLLDMEKWASECFKRNLSDRTPDGKRFHQRSVARLFDLSAPRQPSGFARRPGLSATPEVRARLQALKLPLERPLPRSVMNEKDGEVLVRWVQSIAPDRREAELRYSYARWLFLNGKHQQARDELDGMSPVDIPMTKGGVGARWRVRAAYVAAAATLQLGEEDEAIARFSNIVRARPSALRDQQIVDLSWMAIGRIHHDRGEVEPAVRAYRAISRDSPFFPEAMYETAWTLLRGDHHDRALQALDLLLIYDPNSPIVPEIKQLRGKIKIQQRDWKGAEDEFLGLRREFDELATGLGHKLESRGDAAQYFSAVVAEDMRHFSFDAIMPIEAKQVAQTLPRAVQARDLARDVGVLEQELFETRTLLAQMKEAVGARERTRLFTDLGAHQASLDTATFDLVELQEALLVRVRAKVGGAKWTQYEERRRQLRARVDEPFGKGPTRAATTKRMEDLTKLAHSYDLMIASLRAQLIATERYYEDTRKRQRLDHNAFLKQAGQMRDEIARLEQTVASLQARVRQLGTSLRFSDPWAQARRVAVAEYATYLDGMWQALAKGASDKESRTLWLQIQRLRQRATVGRRTLDGAAGNRLARAIKILAEEEVNLTRYRTELTSQSTVTKKTVGEAMQATYTDVVGELSNLVTRAEVGLLDVAWAIQEVEAEEIRRLEMERERDLKELDRILELGLGELE